MNRLLTVLFLCNAAFAVKHTFSLNLMLSFGIPNVPEYVEVANVEGILMFYYDSKLNSGEARQEWVKKMIEDDSEYWDTQIEECRRYQQLFKHSTQSFKQPSNQSEGTHVIQEIMGCEVDDETKHISGFKQYGYNGEDFIAFDLKTETWVAQTPDAAMIKQEWDENKDDNRFAKNFLITVCPAWLKIYLTYGNSSINRKDLPSVSLLQRTPTAPVRCHGTGFYPENALMFWRKDGGEIHEGVDHGETLPNPDESFQISVDLDVLSIPFEEWGRYECVFQLPGVQNEIVTRLDKNVIQTNWKETEGNLSEISIAVIAVMVVLIVIIVGVVGFASYKKKNERSPTPSSDTISL